MSIYVDNLTYIDISTVLFTPITSDKNYKQISNTYSKKTFHLVVYTFSYKKFPSIVFTSKNLSFSHRCLNKICNLSRTDLTEVTDLMICAPWTFPMVSCLTNGIDHTPCCRAKGLPPICLQLCAGNLTQLNSSYFK